MATRNEEMLKDFYELTGIDCVSGQELEVAKCLMGKLEALGFTVHMDEEGKTLGGNSGNVIGIREGELDGALLFSSHMDRMPNGFGIKPVEKDGVLYSDGTTILAADDLAGVCIILNAVRTMIASGKPLPRLEICFTVQEEPGVWGGRVVDKSQFKSKIAYIFDATDKAGRFVVKGPGRYAMDVTLTGKSAHAGADPEKGIDAARCACEILATVKTGRIDEESTANYPIISCGSARNAVCDHVVFKGEARSRNKAKLEDYVKYFDKHCREIAEKYGCGIEIETEYSYPPLNVEEGAPALVIAKKACEELGLVYNPEPGGGGMDTNWFSDYGMSAIGCGCGYAKNHTKEEYLVLDEWFKAAEMAIRMIEIYSKDCKAK